MADIEIGALSDRLTDDEVTEVVKALQKAGTPKMPKADETLAYTVAKGIDDDVLAEFLDRLEASDIGCEIYLPMEFDGTIEVAEIRVGSLPILIDVLEELKEDLAIDEEDDEEEEAAEDEEEEEEEEEEDEEDEESYEAMQLVEKQLRRLWKLFYDGAHAAMERHLPMYLTTR